MATSERTSNVRQYFAFPAMVVDGDTVARLRDYRLLIETTHGHLIFLALHCRMVQMDRLARQIAAIAPTEDPYLDSRKLNAALHELGIMARLVDYPIEAAHSWKLDAAIADATATAAVRAGRQGDSLVLSRVAIVAEVGGKLSHGLAVFAQNLMSVVAEAAKQMQMLRPSVYNFLVGVDEQSSRNRLQAARIFPLLVPELVRERSYAPLVQVIDRGELLTEALARHFAVAKSVIKCVQGLTLATAGNQWTRRTAILVRLLADQTPEERPADAESWKAFNDAVNFIAEVSRQPIQTAVNRLWLRACARSGYKQRDGAAAAGNPGARHVAEFLARLKEVLSYELRDASRRVFERDVAAAKAVESFLIAYDIRKFIELARRWQHAFLREQASFAAEKDLWLGVKWLSPLSDPMPLGKLTAFPLLNPRDLAEEGQRMRNCVGSYGIPCMQGKSQIFSLRQEGISVSTLETSIKHGANGAPLIYINQHSGVGNKVVSPACDKAACDLLQQLQRQPDALECYLRWKSAIASKPRDERDLTAVVRPLALAFADTLPKAWPLDRLLPLARANLRAANHGLPSL